MGAAMMALDIKMYSIGGLGVFVFPSLIGPDGNLSKVIFAIIIAIVGGVLAFLIQLFVRVPNLYGGGVAKVEEKAEEAAPAPKEIQQEIIASHLLGILSHLTKFLTKSLPQELWVKELLLTLLMG